MPSKAKPQARGRRLRASAQAAQAAADTVEAQAYQQLVAFAKVNTTLRLGVVEEKGNGLSATKTHKSGEVRATSTSLSVDACSASSQPRNAAAQEWIDTDSCANTLRAGPSPF